MSPITFSLLFFYGKNKNIKEFCRSVITGELQLRAPAKNIERFRRFLSIEDTPVSARKEGFFPSPKILFKLTKKGNEYYD